MKRDPRLLITLAAFVLTLLLVTVPLFAQIARGPAREAGGGGGGGLPTTGGTMTGPIDMSDNVISNIGDPNTDFTGTGGLVCADDLACFVSDGPRLDCVSAGSGPTVKPDSLEGAGIDVNASGDLVCYAGNDAVFFIKEEGNQGNSVVVTGSTITNAIGEQATVRASSVLNDASAGGGTQVFSVFEGTASTTTVVGWDEVTLLRDREDNSGAVRFRVDLVGDVYQEGTLELTEASVVGAVGGAGTGRLFIKDDVPTTLHFVDSTGADFMISSGSSGDVVGPASATDLAIAIYDSTTGKLIKNSLVTISALGDIDTHGGDLDDTSDNILTIAAGTLATSSITATGSISITGGPTVVIDGTGVTIGTGEKVDVALGHVELTEQASAPITPIAGDGLLWQLNSTPSQLIYTDDAATDWILNHSIATNVTSAAVIVDHSIVRGDGGSRGTQDTTGASLDDAGALTCTGVAITGSSTIDANGITVVAGDKLDLAATAWIEYVETSTAPGTGGATTGRLWVKDDAPSTLQFTDDTGTDWLLNQTAGVTNVTAVSTFAVDNTILRADTGGTRGAQASGVSIDDSNNVTGVVGLTCSGDIELGLGQKIILETNGVNDTWIESEADESVSFLFGAGGTPLFQTTVEGLFCSSGQRLAGCDSLNIAEAASVPDTVSATRGTYWVRDDNPTAAMFTDGSNQDWELRSLFLDSFTANDAMFPATNPAAGSSRGATAHALLGFDDTTAECVIFEGTMGDYSGVTLTVVPIYAMSTATSGTVKWDISWERLNDGFDIDADSFATLQTTGAVTVPGVAGALDYDATATFSQAQADAIVRWEAYRLKVCRDPPTDSATGDGQILRIVIPQ